MEVIERIRHPSLAITLKRLEVWELQTKSLHSDACLGIQILSAAREVEHQNLGVDARL